MERNELFTTIQRLARTTTPEELTAALERMMEERRRRKRAAMERARERWDDALLLMTSEQVVRTEQLLREGYKENKAWVSRSGDRVAILFVGPQKWSTAKQRLVRELRVLYPDGHSTSTQERTISVRKDF